MHCDCVAHVALSGEITRACREMEFAPESTFSRYDKTEAERTNSGSRCDERSVNNLIFILLRQHG